MNDESLDSLEDMAAYLCCNGHNYEYIERMTPVEIIDRCNRISKQKSDEQNVLLQTIRLFIAESVSVAIAHSLDKKDHLTKLSNSVKREISKISQNDIIEDIENDDMINQFDSEFGDGL